MEENKPINMVYLFEQLETNADNLAKLLSSYYDSLIENEIPEEIAKEIILQTNLRFWNVI